MIYESENKDVSNYLRWLWKHEVKLTTGAQTKGFYSGTKWTKTPLNDKFNLNFRLKQVWKHQLS